MGTSPDWSRRSVGTGPDRSRLGVGLVRIHWGMSALTLQDVSHASPWRTIQRIFHSSLFDESDADSLREEREVGAQAEGGPRRS